MVEWFPPKQVHQTLKQAPTDSICVIPGLTRDPVF